MMNASKSHLPIIAGLGLTVVNIGTLLIHSMSGTDGLLVYALDDAYIHLSISRTLAEHGIWGISPDGFTSSSSSLSWTLLLALVQRVFGPNNAAPFLLNALFAILAQVYLYVLLRQYRLQPGIIFLVLVAFAFFTPLTALVFSGLEHTLHVLLTIAFVHLAARLLCGNGDRGWRLWALLILAPLLTMTRFESLFLLAVTGLLFLLRRRLVHTLLLAAAGTLPIVIYGIISLHKGWYFLPNSVLLKGNIPDPHDLRTIFKAAYQFVQAKTIALSVLIVLAAVVACVRYRRDGGLWRAPTVMAVIFVLAALLHLQFADVGWLLRYEAYLVGLGIFVLAVGFSTAPGNRPGRLPAWLLVLALPLVWRGLTGLLVVPVAAKNIYEQQYQMGLFIDRFYAGSAVAANDIGAINYLADVHCVDLWGLTDLQVGRWKMEREYNTAKIDQLTKEHGVRVAIVYDEWLDRYGGLPEHWVRVGQWKISHNAVCSEDTVSIYAADPAEQANLIENLQAFAPDLPRDVAQMGLYTE